jgi:hypothetical protein
MGKVRATRFRKRTRKVRKVRTRKVRTRKVRKVRTRKVRTRKVRKVRTRKVRTRKKGGFRLPWSKKKNIPKSYNELLNRIKNGTDKSKYKIVILVRHGASCANLIKYANPKKYAGKGGAAADAAAANVAAQPIDALPDVPAAPSPLPEPEEPDEYPRDDSSSYSIWKKSSRWKPSARHWAHNSVVDPNLTMSGVNRSQNCGAYLIASLYDSMKDPENFILYHSSLLRAKQTAQNMIKGYNDKFNSQVGRSLEFPYMAEKSFMNTLDNTCLSSLLDNRTDMYGRCVMSRENTAPPIETGFGPTMTGGADETDQLRNMRRLNEIYSLVADAKHEALDNKDLEASLTAYNDALVMAQKYGNVTDVELSKIRADAEAVRVAIYKDKYMKQNYKSFQRNCKKKQEECSFDEDKALKELSKSNIQSFISKKSDIPVVVMVTHSGVIKKWSKLKINNNDMVVGLFNRDTREFEKFLDVDKKEVSFKKIDKLILSREKVIKIDETMKYATGPPNVSEDEYNDSILTGGGWKEMETEFRSLTLLKKEPQSISDMEPSISMPSQDDPTCNEEVEWLNKELKNINSGEWKPLSGKGKVKLELARRAVQKAVDAGCKMEADELLTAYRQWATLWAKKDLVIINTDDIKPKVLISKDAKQNFMKYPDEFMSAVEDDRNFCSSINISMENVNMARKEGLNHIQLRAEKADANIRAVATKKEEAYNLKEMKKARQAAAADADPKEAWVNAMQESEENLILKGLKEKLSNVKRQIALTDPKNKKEIQKLKTVKKELIKKILEWSGNVKKTHENRVGIGEMYVKERRAQIKKEKDKKQKQEQEQKNTGHQKRWAEERGHGRARWLRGAEPAVAWWKSSVN